MIYSTAMMQFISVGTTLLLASILVPTADATVLRSKKVLGDLKIQSHPQQPIHVVKKFLNKEEIEIFQNNAHMESFSTVYGYGKVDVEKSFIDRIKLILEEIDNADIVRAGSGEEGTLVFFLAIFSSFFLENSLSFMP